MQNMNENKRHIYFHNISASDISLRSRDAIANEEMLKHNELKALFFEQWIKFMSQITYAQNCVLHTNHCTNDACNPYSHVWPVHVNVQPLTVVGMSIFDKWDSSMTINLLLFAFPDFEHIIEILSTKSLKFIPVFLHVSERMLASTLVLDAF